MFQWDSFRPDLGIDTGGGEVFDPGRNSGILFGERADLFAALCKQGADEQASLL